MKQVILIGMFLFACCVTTTNAQAKTIDNSANRNVNDVISRLDMSQYIYIKTFKNKKVNGKIFKVENDTLYLLKRHKEISLPVSDIQQIKIKKGQRTAFLLTGGAVGMAIGYSVGHSLASSFSFGGGPSKNDLQTAGTAGALVGGVLGLGVGIIAGKLNEKDEVLYNSSNSKMNNISFYIAPDLKGSVYLSATVSF